MTNQYSSSTMTTTKWFEELYSETPSLEELLPPEPKDSDSTDLILDNEELFTEETTEADVLIGAPLDETNSSLCGSDTENSFSPECLEHFNESTPMRDLEVISLTENNNDNTISEYSKNCGGINLTIFEPQDNVNLKNYLPCHSFATEQKAIPIHIDEEESSPPTEYSEIPQIVSDIGEYNRSKLQNEAEKLLTDKIVIECITAVSGKTVAEETYSDNDIFSVPAVQDIGDYNKTKLHQQADELLKAETTKKCNVNTDAQVVLSDASNGDIPHF